MGLSKCKIVSLFNWIQIQQKEKKTKQKWEPHVVDKHVIHGILKFLWHFFSFDTSLQLQFSSVITSTAIVENFLTNQKIKERRKKTLAWNSACYSTSETCLTSIPRLLPPSSSVPFKLERTMASFVRSLRRLKKWKLLSRQTHTKRRTEIVNKKSLVTSECFFLLLSPFHFVWRLSSTFSK